MSDWFYKQQDKEFGPVTRAELDFLASIGRIQAATLVRDGARGTWQPFAPKRRRKKQQSDGIASSRAAPSNISLDSESPASEANSDISADANAASEKRPGNEHAVEDLPEEGADNRTRNAVIGAVALLLSGVLLVLLLWDQLPSGAGTDPAGTSVANDFSGIDAGDPNQHSDQKANDSAVGDASDSRGPAPAAQPPQPTDVEAAPTGSSGASVAEATANASAEATGEARDKLEFEVSEMPANTVVAGDPQSRFTIEAPGEARFFGLTASGRRFSFVVDRSASMAGVPLRRAKEELMKCIRSLPRHVEVQVVFFDNVAEEAPGGFRRLTRRGIDSLQDWVDRVAEGGGTEVNTGMQMAFSSGEEPDAIFLLTDGEFAAGSPAFIRKLNASNKVQVNTVALVSDAGAPLLKQIAKDNRGDYRFVP